MALHKILFDSSSAAGRADTHQIGAVLYDSVNDRLGLINASQELLVRDGDSVNLLTTIDADTSAMAVDLAAIEVEQLAQGVTLDSILVDTSAMVVDLAAIEVEQLAQGVTLDGILADTAAMVIDLAAIEVEQLAQGVTLDSILVDTGVIASDTTSMDSTLTGLSHAEDAAHVSGDAGIQALAVRNDTLAPLSGTDGDYSALQVNANGALYVEAVGTGGDVALADSAIKQVAEVVGVAAAVVVDGADELASRKYFYVYNNDTQDAYIGDSGVSAANGFPIPPGAILDARIGAAVDIYMIGAKAAMDIRTLQLS